jgi:hypothetical protein
VASAGAPGMRRLRPSLELIGRPEGHGTGPSCEGPNKIIEVSSCCTAGVFSPLPPGAPADATGAATMEKSPSSNSNVNGIEWVDWLDEYKKYKEAKTRSEEEAARSSAVACTGAGSWSIGSGISC